MRHEMKYFFLGAITTGLIAAGIFAMAPVNSQADQHEQAAQNGNPGGHPGDRKPPERLPKTTSELKGSIVVAIDVADGETTEYIGEGPAVPPTEVDWSALGKIQIESVQNARGTDIVIIKYSASPDEDVICKWVRGDYKCYNT